MREPYGLNGIQEAIYRWLASSLQWWPLVALILVLAFVVFT